MFSRVHHAALAAVLVLSLPAAARAVTLDDIIALSKAGVSSEILVAVIDADRTIFNLIPSEIVVLKKAGVPNEVILKMLGSAREFVEEVPPPLIVGGDPPSAPQTTERPTAFEMYGVPGFVPGVPYFVAPYPVFVVPGLPPHLSTQPAQPARGFGRFMNNGFVSGRGAGRFMNNGFIAAPPPKPAK
jgi:hypothetical protein